MITTISKEEKNNIVVLENTSFSNEKGEGSFTHKTLQLNRFVGGLSGLTAQKFPRVGQTLVASKRTRHRRKVLEYVSLFKNK